MPSQKESNLPTIQFQGRTVSFREGNTPAKPNENAHLEETKQNIKPCPATNLLTSIFYNKLFQFELWGWVYRDQNEKKTEQHRASENFSLPSFFLWQKHLVYVGIRVTPLPIFSGKCEDE